ncbi:hypothetical protein A3B32_01535 [Candidatus Uhrbacteria bacterium RIFCSPLOWO2_01_FULL_53_9]|uniref:CoA-binding domain-containing protein n=2 Tax=Candidatus Uhriibacteriota TaxID=1752732 RepID=A0A1F7UYX3_9BACT|nr:MAG: hypothetical protein A3C17_03305 [Candidatus Uhrbacteria bacterium RIFCSPHIGHO2_02_FULL_53_13]OGL83471.1 MAG: hypothetical protein A3B32_01535 [Candidatus Uhrbacteria bacterium RIFCSPLOWO2_01_FULL_53_9]
MLITKDTQVLVQGITGKEGQRAARAMLDYGTRVVAGVRPGKAGEIVEGIPVYDSVADALQTHPKITDSAVYVPPSAAKAAILEAVHAGIKRISVIVERMPIRDTAECLAEAKEHGATIIGPSSLGYIRPGVGRVGVVGGPKKLVHEVYTSGSIGIISRSGGMTNELSWLIRQAGLGQSMAVHVGGDLLLGTTYTEVLKMFQDDAQTKAVVVFGEHGGGYEFEIADMLKTGVFSKPLAIYIGGAFAESFPEGMSIGHAGAIVERGRGAHEKRMALKQAGAMIADSYEELVSLIRETV